MPADYENDPTISDQERLLRRIHEQQIVPDENREGTFRVSSGAFRDKELSIVIESLLRESGRRPDDVVANHDFHSLVAITAGLARKYEQAIVRDPEPDEPAHGLVYGNKKQRQCDRALAASAEWVVYKTRRVARSD
jgi:hypothetical protein